MASVTCPKCGFEQDGGRECLKCGIIFDRYQPPEELPAEFDAPPPEEILPEETGPNAFIRFYRIFRWVVLAGAALVILLILYQSPPPHIDSDPQALERVEAKLRDFDRAARRGQPHTLRMNEAELNSWLNSNLALAPDPSVAKAAETSTSAMQVPELPGANAPPQPTLEEVKSNVRDVKIDLVEDRVRAYVVFNLYGKDLSLLLEGRLRAENGYLRLEPTSVKLGSLPVPQSTINSAVRRVFESPENKEKFRLPPDISDLRVQNSELVVSYR